MEVRYYIRTAEYKEGQHGRLEGGYVRPLRASLNTSGNLVLGNPEWDHMVLNLDDLDDFFREKGLTLGVRPDTVAVDQGGTDTRD